MKTVSAAALCSVAAGALLIGAVPAQADEGGPAVPNVKLSFVPKTRVTYVGKNCRNSSNTEKAVIALSGKKAIAFGERYSIEIAVKAPGRAWGASYEAFGPDLGFTGSKALSKTTFATLPARKAGVYQVMVRSMQKLEVDTDTNPLSSDDLTFVHGPWSAPMKVKVTKKQLKKTKSITAKGRCYA